MSAFYPKGTASMCRFVFAVVICFVTLSPVRGQEAKVVFGPTVVHEFHLELSAKEWARMQKVSGGVGLFTPKKPVAPAGEEPYEWHKSPGSGLEFPWAHA